MYRRIRDLREDNDLKQRTLGDYLGCTQATYSKYELGKRSIPPELLLKLAVYYNTSVDYLLGLTDVMEPYPRTKKGKDTALFSG